MVKAVHLDLVADLSTDAFLASLRRFVALHGAPSDLYSDNGSNFRGADLELQRIFTLLESTSTQDRLQNWAFTRSCRWHNSPSRAPHFGGLWESAVKVMKRLLKKVFGEQVLRVDELQTFLFEAAAVMNSRPLAPVDAHSSDGTIPLTPGHFLTGGPLTALPSEPDPVKTYTYSRR